MMVATFKNIKKIDNGTIVSPKGFSVDGLHSGVKRKRKDLGIIVSDIQASAAAVYTMNLVQAAPIKITKEALKKSPKIKGVIVNSGNANACTGDQGERDAYDMQAVTAKKLGVQDSEVAVASTGVIGLDMPMDKIIPNIDELTPDRSSEAAAKFNESILTTDTIQKSTCYEATIDGEKVLMGGSAKGSGMIEPNMATMLAFVTTDANIASDVLEGALKEVTDKTFNCITVDGDTSTNDIALVMANGLAGNEPLTPTHKDWHVFMELLRKTCEDLAKMIAQDGEGATKLIEVEVKGSPTETEAIKVAKSIVGSSLVKTAVFGTDANWGRIIAAIGYSGVAVNIETVDLYLGHIELLNKSKPTDFSEEEATEYLQNDTVKIVVDLNIGEKKGTAWGCDLTYDYVRINASYRS